jgi:hypothetical protein
MHIAASTKIAINIVKLVFIIITFFELFFHCNRKPPYLEPFCHSEKCYFKKLGLFTKLILAYSILFVNTAPFIA